MASGLFQKVFTTSARKRPDRGFAVVAVVAWLDFRNLQEPQNLENDDDLLDSDAARVISMREPLHKERCGIGPLTKAMDVLSIDRV